MRAFHVLSSLVGREHLQRVVDYDMGIFNPNVFMACSSFSGKLPKEMKLFVSGGKTSDLLLNGVNLAIVSENLLGILQKFSADFEAFDAPIFNKTSMENVPGYKILNITCCLQAVDMEHSEVRQMGFGQEFMHFMKFAFQESLIPSGIHLFRPRESRTQIIISDELAQAMVGNVEGVILTRTKTI